MNTEKVVGKYYLNDPNAPKPNQATRIGTNAVVVWNNRILLEKRSDCSEWGLIGGRLRNGEKYEQGISRELREETGIFVTENRFQQLRILEDNRIAAYRDGSVWRMVIVLFYLELDHEPNLKISKESKNLEFFTRDELENIKIVNTHSDIVMMWKNNTL